MLDVKLVVVGGATEGDEFQLELPAVLGRGRDVSLPLPHPLISRRHCELSDRDGLLIVRDLGSTNGTFVGSERIDESVLAHGQLLTIGTVTLRAFYAGHPAPAVSAVSVAIEVGGAVPAQGLQLPADDDTTTIARTEAGHDLPQPHPRRVGQRAK